MIFFGHVNPQLCYIIVRIVPSASKRSVCSGRLGLSELKGRETVALSVIPHIRHAVVAFHVRGPAPRLKRMRCVAPPVDVDTDILCRVRGGSLKNAGWRRSPRA